MVLFINQIKPHKIKQLKPHKMEKFHNNNENAYNVSIRTVLYTIQFNVINAVILLSMMVQFINVINS